MKQARVRYLNKQERDSPEVIVRWGPTGTYKTENAFDIDWPDVSAYLKDVDSGKWYCDYDGHEKVIYDEFRGEKHMTMSQFNKLTQKRPTTVQPKFGRWCGSGGGWGGVQTSVHEVPSSELYGEQMLPLPK